MVKKKKLLKKKAAKKKVIKKELLKKRPVKKKKLAAKTAIKKPKENVLGTITHYFPKVRAAVVKLQAPLAAGDTIKIKGHTTDFTQTITSIQLEHAAINSAKKGQEIGLLTDSRVRQHDIVYKVKKAEPSSL